MRGPPQGRTFRRAWSAVSRSVRDAAGRHGFAEPDVLLRWHEVVGAALAGVCRPLRVEYGRRATGLGATLTVATDGAHATEIAHQSQQIIDRVNGFYGYRAVSRIRIDQSAGHAPGFAERGTGFAPEAATPDVKDSNARARAEAITARVENPELRAALTGLGESILGRRAGAPGKD